MDVPHLWGVTKEEIAAGYPCDEVLPVVRGEYLRGITVRAEPAVVFRWLCQLKVAPYSFDLLDNLGRRSPRTLTPGAERLERGQRVMTIFQLVDFAPDQHLTLLLDHPRGRLLYGDIAVSYTVHDAPRNGDTRLVVKLCIGGGNTLLHRTRRGLLAWGDLFMMREQLSNLRKLAEREPRQTGN
ncbi:hypothetical protein ACZ90_39125 [Streptomyces albus subsp. albus]|nr:hypothetical protein ACZ90_39125 [Streptomyces albus subsp. albus]